MVKKLSASDLVKKTPGPPSVDFAVRNRLNKLKGRKSTPAPPPSPPPLSFLLLLPLLPPPWPPSSFSFNLPSAPPQLPPPPQRYFLSIYCHPHQMHHHLATDFFQINRRCHHHLEVFVFQHNRQHHQIICSDLKHKHWYVKKKKQKMKKSRTLIKFKTCQQYLNLNLVIV